MSKQLFWVFLILSVGLSGCARPPAYVGTYRVLMDERLKQALAQAEARDAAQKGLTREQSEADLKASEAIFANSSLTINANGTCTMSIPWRGGGIDDSDGTYTVAGNKLTVVIPHTPTVVYTFNEAERKLIDDSSDPEAVSFVKK